MAANRTATKKPVARTPAARKPAGPKAKPAAAKAKPAASHEHETHGVAGLVDRILRFTEHAALRVALMAKHGRRRLLRHA
ncbi:MAG TPA: hypothetical protein VNN79_03045 [Actinomycetota bacterium]|nr:hypothetical protein [Actinomycetota bacterium]